MDNPISRAEHNEFCKRMEEEHSRQNVRIKVLEEESKKITDIVLSINELALSIKNMTTELKEQGTKLEKLEAKDGEMWRKVVGYAITAVVGIVVGFIFRQLGM